VIALTSLSPSPHRVEVQTECLKSWRAIGLRPLSLNAHSELAFIRDHYAADVMAVAAPVEHGRPLIFIDTMLAEVKRIGEPALLINADVELAMTAAQLARLELASRAGLGYIRRFNHDGDKSKGIVEPYGIDAFLLRPRHADLVPSSTLRFGEPWWDYLLPWTAVRHGERLYTPTRPMVYHLRHEGKWSDESWHRNAVEFARAAGLPSVDEDEDDAQREMANEAVELLQSHTQMVDVDA
jgi:hypothetical protein